MIRALIIDDEPPARKGVRLRLESETDIEIVGESGDGQDAVREIRRLRPDLVFLDVQMPGLDGFGVLDSLGPEEWPPAVVFVTAFDRHALRAFDTHAIDYVVKPLVDERFHRALDRARETLRSRAAVARHDALAAFLARHPFDDEVPAPEAGAVQTPDEPPMERISVRTGSRYRLLDLADVEWFEAARNYVRLHIAGEPALARMRLSELERRIDRRRFARTHRSFIVNLDHVLEIRRVASDRWVVVLQSGQEVPLSRSYRARFLGAGGTR